MNSKDVSKNVKVYKGNLLFTARVLIAIGFLMFVGAMVLNKPSVVLKNYGAIFSISFAIIIMVVFTVIQLYYFIIDDDKFVVKNQILIWTKKVYELNNIHEIELVELSYYSRSAIALRVIDDKFKSKLYRAGSLSKKTWKALLADLKECKIEVNDSYTQFENN
ncbi:MAG TPA: hypothetical protein VIJ92_02505 [Ginsengibacter sp.]